MTKVLCKLKALNIIFIKVAMMVFKEIQQKFIRNLYENTGELDNQSGSESKKNENRLSFFKLYFRATVTTQHGNTKYT